MHLYYEKGYLIISYTLLLYHVRYTCGCVCLGPHPQDAFCGTIRGGGTRYGKCVKRGFRFTFYSLAKYDRYRTFCNGNTGQVPFLAMAK